MTQEELAAVLDLDVDDLTGHSLIQKVREQAKAIHDLEQQIEMLIEMLAKANNMRKRK